MLVALLVGAIRTITELNSDPLIILQTLNRRLIGRGEAHATCLALRIAVHGVTFGRITPMVNWDLSQNVRLEAGYGYGQLDRFNLKGNTQFSQTRLQLQY
jgi:hypothetical protein